MPRPLLWAVIASLILHGSMVAGFIRPRPLSPLSLNAPPLQLRVVQGALTGRAQEQRLAEPSSSATPVTVESTRQVPSPNATADVRPVAAAPEAPAAPALTGPLTQPLPPAPEYRASGMDPPPRPLENIDLEYPPEAGTVEGTVLLRLLINASGTVDDVAVVRATPPGYFEASALKAFARARFSPGYFLGIAVKSQYYVEVGYTPINRGAAVSGQGQ